MGILYWVISKISPRSKILFSVVLKMGTRLQIELLALDRPELTLHTHTNSVLASCRNKVHKASSISILALWTDLWAFSLTSPVGLYGSNLQMAWYLLGLLSEECSKHKKMLVFYIFLNFNFFIYFFFFGYTSQHVELPQPGITTWALCSGSVES